MKYKLLIVDLGNVLVNFDHRIAADRLQPFTPSSVEVMRDLFFDSDLLRDFEKGKFSESEFFTIVKKKLRLNIEYDKFLPIWEDIFYLTQDNKKLLELLKALKDKYKLVLLSNINKLHFEYINRKFNIFSVFDKLVLSYEVGMRKPDPNIYKHTLDLLSVRPQEAVYIDDRADLVEKAGSFGIDSIAFKGFSDLTIALRKRGILDKDLEAALI